MAIHTHLDDLDVAREKPPYHLLSDELLRALDERYERRKEDTEEMAKIDYTPISSEILRHLVSHDFSVGELKVILVILRVKSGSAISLPQFQNLTGFTKSTICKAISRLQDRGILSLGKGTFGPKTTYLINNLPQTWDCGLMGLVTARVKSQACDPPPPEKAPPDPRIKVAMDYYYEKFKTKFGQPPVINGAKDGSILKGLLSDLELDRVKELLDDFFESDDEFIQGSGYTLGVFSVSANKLITQAGKRTGPSTLPAWAKDKK